MLNSATVIDKKNRRSQKERLLSYITASDYFVYLALTFSVAFLSNSAGQHNVIRT